MNMFVSGDDEPVEFWDIDVEYLGKKTAQGKEIEISSFLKWALSRYYNQALDTTRTTVKPGAVIAVNPDTLMPDSVAFHTVVAKDASLIDASDNVFKTETDPFSGINVRLKLDGKNNYKSRVTYVLGVTENDRQGQKAENLMAKYRDTSRITRTFEKGQEEWTAYLDDMKLETPDGNFNRMFDWMRYQAVIWHYYGKAGYYQPGGAFGFRDQLQTVFTMASSNTPGDIARAREHILRCAARQFPEGDVLHWWHDYGFEKISRVKMENLCNDADNSGNAQSAIDVALTLAGRLDVAENRDSGKTPLFRENKRVWLRANIFPIFPDSMNNSEDFIKGLKNKKLLRDMKYALDARTLKADSDIEVCLTARLYKIVDSRLNQLGGYGEKRETVRGIIERDYFDKDLLTEEVGEEWTESDSDLLRLAGKLRNVDMKPADAASVRNIIDRYRYTEDGREVSLGIRSRVSDNLLWLPFALAHYADVTGDMSLLKESAPYISGRQLTEEEKDYVSNFVPSEQSASVYDHAKQSIELVLTKRMGKHGLPLIGTGDWNDGLDEIGSKGKGETVWGAFFLYRVLLDFSALARKKGEIETAEKHEAAALELSKNIEKHTQSRRGLTGRWFIRAFTDEGKRMEKLDALPQAWAVISGAVGDKLAKKALWAALDELYDEDINIIRLFDKPVDRQEDENFPLGHMGKYFPGDRENGGQYTHGISWIVFGLAQYAADHPAESNKKGYGDLLWKVAKVLNPAEHARKPNYNGEPYVAPADINPEGIAGWTGYTGSAGWIFRTMIEGMLGLKFQDGNRLFINPVLPAESWGTQGYNLIKKFGASSYSIKVENPQGVSAGVAYITVDGERIDPAQGVLLLDDGKEHEVAVVMGKEQDSGILAEADLSGLYSKVRKRWYEYRLTARRDRDLGR
ncbi:MAG TPA: hypothetical protein VJC03_01785, partial [bacterium]|nr:hypothetical protein [bacterium]